MKIINIKRLIVLLLVFCFVNTSVAFSKELKFAQLTDVHYAPQGTQSNGRDVSSSSDNLGFAITSLNKANLDFVVFLGDNIDKSNKESLLGFLRMVQHINKPFYLALGNHDSYKVSGIPKKEYMAAVNIYNPNQKSDKPYYFFCPNKDVVCIVLDGSMPFVPSAHGAYSDDSIVWLDSVLNKNKNKLALIFQHFPLIPPNDTYSHTTLETDKYFDLLSNHDNIVLISSGHYHDDKVVQDSDGVYHISAPALLTDPHQYEIVTLKYNKKLLMKPSKPKVSIKRIKV